MSASRVSGSVAEFVLQFYISENGEELSCSNFVHCFGVQYDVAFEEDSYMIEAKTLVTPGQNQELHELEEFKDAEFFTISWSDIAWYQFDWSQGAHAD